MRSYPLEAIAAPAALSLDAASQADITRSSIAQAMAALAKEGGSMTQVAIARVAIARVVGAHQGYIVGFCNLLSRNSLSFSLKIEQNDRSYRKATA
jgi:hypothetical protein